MPTEQKKQVIQELEKQAREAKGLVITSFKGMKTVEFNEMRQKLKPFQSEYRVVKNSLTKIALKNAGLEDLAKALEGPSAIVIERGDAFAALKVIFDFAKSHENVKVNGGYVDGKVFDGKQLKAVAGLPTREVLLAKLLGALQGPAVNLVSVLQAPIRDLVGVLDQVAKKPQAK